MYIGKVSLKVNVFVEIGFKHDPSIFYMGIVTPKGKNKETEHIGRCFKSKRVVINILPHKPASNIRLNILWLFA